MVKLLLTWSWLNKSCLSSEVRGGIPSGASFLILWFPVACHNFTSAQLRYWENPLPSCKHPQASRGPHIYLPGHAPAKPCCLTACSHPLKQIPPVFWICCCLTQLKHITHGFRRARKDQCATHYPSSTSWTMVLVLHWCRCPFKVSPTCKPAKNCVAPSQSELVREQQHYVTLYVSAFHYNNTGGLYVPTTIAATSGRLYWHQNMTSDLRNIYGECLCLFFYKIKKCILDCTEAVYSCLTGAHSAVLVKSSCKFFLNDQIGSWVQQCSTKLFKQYSLPFMNTNILWMAAFYWELCFSTCSRDAGWVCLCACVWEKIDT